MTKSYTVKSVNSTALSMLVEFTDDSRVTQMNLPLPIEPQTVDDVVKMFWPGSFEANPSGVAAATALVGIATESVVSLDETKAAQVAILNAGCATTIATGFQSDALDPGGSTYLYPCSLTDQLNMTASVTDAIRTPTDWQADWTYGLGDSVASPGGRLLCTVSGKSGKTAPSGPGTDGKVTWAAWTTPFMCRDGQGNWAMRDHSAAQIEQAGADGKSFILGARIKFATLSSQVMAAEDAAAVTAITWSFP